MRLGNAHRRMDTQTGNGRGAHVGAITRPRRGDSERDYLDKGSKRGKCERDGPAGAK